MYTFEVIDFVWRMFLGQLVAVPCKESQHQYNTKADQEFTIRTISFKVLRWIMKLIENLELGQSSEFLIWIKILDLNVILNMLHDFYYIGLYEEALALSNKLRQC